MKTIIITLLLTITFTACEPVETNTQQSESTYKAPDFKVPELMIGEYVNADHNFNKGNVSITDKLIIINTEIYKASVPVNNEMYYNGCYILIHMPDGSTLEVWLYTGHTFIKIDLIDEGVEYKLGRFEPVEPVEPEPVKPIYN